MTDPLRASASSRTPGDGASPLSGIRPACGRFLCKAGAFGLSIVTRPSLALVTAMQNLHDRTADAYRSRSEASDAGNRALAYEQMQSARKPWCVQSAAEPESGWPNGLPISGALSFLEHRLRTESSRGNLDRSPHIRGALLQLSQAAAVALGLPVTGGLIGIANGLADILAGLSIRRATRIDAFASKTVEGRAVAARADLVLLGLEKTRIAALLTDPRADCDGLPYGKGKRSGTASMSGEAHDEPAPADRRAKYSGHVRGATDESIRHAVLIANRILTAIACNEVGARARARHNDGAALVRIAMGLASVALGVALIACGVLHPSTTLPLLLATVGLHVLHRALSRPTRNGDPADEMVVTDTLHLLANRAPEATLARKFVKALLREHGMDGLGLRVLHIAQVRDKDRGSCAASHGGAQGNPPDLKDAALEMIASQLETLMTGSTARDAVTHRRVFVRNPGEAEVPIAQQKGQDEPGLR